MSECGSKQIAMGDILGDCQLCSDLQAEIERLQAALAIMWHAYNTDNRPPHQVVKIARECYELGKLSRALSVDRRTESMPAEQHQQNE